MAIGAKDWRPRIISPPIQIMRFGPKLFESGVETHDIEGVSVRIYGAAKTVVDEFRIEDAASRRYGKGLSSFTHAVEGLKRALRDRKAMPADIAQYAIEAGPRTWELVRRYLDVIEIGRAHV